MKLPQLNNNNSRLHVYIKGSAYSYPLYVDFNTKKELDDYMLNMFYTKRNQYDYFYGG